uniref:Cytochrome c oxidase subunit 2 n=1 Tax=Batillipes longispinosus TaxID=1477119 RepID=A0A0K0KAY3_9BILA|nr:cytochrome c oxidase subunit II [Batillipes longispinosus]
MLATWEQLNFQDGMSPMMAQMSQLHDHIMTILGLITGLVLYLLIFITLNNKFSLSNSENHSLEFVWTVAPSILLIMIATPSLRVLYLTEENYDPLLTLKTVAHQWYWSYEYSDFNNLSFDSFMNKDINKDSVRLLDVDNRVVLPVNSPIQVFITSGDVLHSWAIPSLAVKADATPGRLNQVHLFTPSVGLFYGQCSELCGANHSFMPICVEFTSFKGFKNWINSVI